MPSGIYVIRNTVNGKAYVGSAVDVKGRWSRHRFDLVRGTHHSTKLQRAWRKYGDQAFVFEVVMVCARDYLLFLEQIWLDGQGAVKSGYNIEPKAGSSLGRKVSAATKKKLSDHFTGLPRNLTPESRKAMSEKVSAAKKGKKRAAFSADWLANLSAARLGKKFSEAHKAKISAAHIGRTHTEASKAKMAASHTGKMFTAEQKENMSKARMGVKRGKYKTIGKYTYKTRKRGTKACQ